MKIIFKKFLLASIVLCSFRGFGMSFSCKQDNFIMGKICGIYKITNPKRKVYIGKSVNCYARLSKYKGLFCEEQTKLYRSIKKYGWTAHKFEIIHQCLPEELNTLEVYYIALYQCFNSEHGMNLQSGGSSHTISDETRKRLSAVRKGKKTTLGYKPTPETKKKLSEANKGKHDYLRLWNLGSKRSEECKKRMGWATRKKVVDTKTGQIFDSLTKAALFMNMKTNTLGVMLNGTNRNKTTLKWL